MNKRCLLLSIPCIALAGLISGQAGADAADPPKIRLSGTTIISPTKGTALIEYEDGRSYRVQPGDTVEGWGRVSYIGRDRMDIESADGSRVMRLTGKPGVTILPAESRNDPVATAPVTLSTAGPELVAEIERLVHQKSAIGEDLNGILVPLLGLPPAARIIAVHHQPLSQDGASIRYIQQALEQGGMVRLSIEGGDGVDTIYLGPPDQPELGQIID